MDETDRLQAPFLKIAPTSARFIRLGTDSGFAETCIREGFIGLDFRAIPHELCASGQWDLVHERFVADGRAVGVATRHVGEIRDFYELGADTLWITFVKGVMWWTMAQPAVTWHENVRERLPRRRASVGGWRSTDVNGRALTTRNLSGRLTSVGAFQGTICDVRERDYLIRKINGEPEPLIVEAETAHAALLDLTCRLIARLHHREFELLVDLIFNASGWRRVSILGESEADIDLLVEQIATGERAFVQVKSQATPAVLQDYIERYRNYPDCSRLFFVCHSPSPALERLRDVPADVDLWFKDRLTRKVLQSGLLDWVIDRVR